MTPLTIAERSRLCEEIAEALTGKTVAKIEIFISDNGRIGVGEIVLKGGKSGTVILDRDYGSPIDMRIYRPGTGHTPETWQSWEGEGEP